MIFFFFFTKEHILNKIWKMVEKIIPKIYIDTITIDHRETVSDIYDTLQNMIFDRYVRSKTLKLNRIIEESIMCDGINWEVANEPRSVRNHILHLLLQMVFVHNQVYNNAKNELSNVLKSLLEKIADHFLANIKSIDRFSRNGALQLLVEADFIRKCLQKYIEPGTAAVFQQIRQLLTANMPEDGIKIYFYVCFFLFFCFSFEFFIDETINTKYKKKIKKYLKK